MVSLYEELKINKYAEPALIFIGSKMKREKFIENIDLMASFLDEIGVKQGESVGILSPNIPSAGEACSCRQRNFAPCAYGSALSRGKANAAGGRSG